MDTPRRRSRRLGGLKAEPPGSPAAVLRARRALAEFESDREEPREPASPRRVRPPGLESPRRQPETRPGSPSLGSPRREPGPGSPQGQQDPGPGSPRREPASSPERPRREPQPGGASPQAFRSRGEPGAELAPSAEELARRSPRHQPPGPGSPEPHPGQPAPGPEPSPPPQERTPPPPGSARGPQLPSQPPPAREPVRDGLWPKKRKGSPPRAPAPKKLEEEVAVPLIPKGKPKSGRVWKDRAKKRFSQMVQDKPLRTSWQRKMKERQERKLARDFARHLEEEKERRRQEKQQRRAENLKRRLENERKAEVVQVIRNPAKLKRAKKKQLRSIQKRDTLALLQPPPRPPAQV
ncbi:coiled-coil domain-containing protein 86 [Eptesicus fuscus]|uniref:coiled-coil domain-containing protein 86 n=1 Tax=Eptesicus fuscus TaxID=29078 RepID=UPI00240413AB|nr:coiled-coil domain-containing protein 86 [Eptesicus fuscus]